MALDKFGRLLRDIRITRSLLLYDMARDLGMSSADLSSIETGKKPIPKDLFQKFRNFILLATFVSVCSKCSPRKERLKYETWIEKTQRATTIPQLGRDCPLSSGRKNRPEN